jgi:hypothetical protein
MKERKYASVSKGAHEGSMKASDQDMVLATIDIFRSILLQPSPDPKVTLQRLRSVMADPDFTNALDQLNKRRLFRVVK